MKHVIIPILQFLWAIFLTTICFAIHIIVVLWTLKPVGKFNAYHSELQLSPYFQPEHHSTRRTEFKTIFHYIWGIKQKQ